MGTLMQSIDWSSTPLGAVETWSQSLHTSLSICLQSRFPILIWWGRELVMLYNDAYRPILGVSKHPKAIGQRGQDCWVEIWHVIEPMLESVLTQRKATWSDNQLLLLNRNGYLEESYFTFSYSPILDEMGGVGGIFTAVTETTEQVLSERRLRTLHGLAAKTSETATIKAACEASAAVLSENPDDIPFALLYLLDPSNQRATLTTAVGLKAGTTLSPRQVDYGVTEDDLSDCFRQALQTGHPQMLCNLSNQIDWSQQSVALIPENALVIPIARSGQEQLADFLIVGVSPRRSLDEDYRNFFGLVAGQVATSIANANAYEAERKRAEALAELDHAKTLFFTNISHEFRTPLTLMLSPLEDLSLTLTGRLQPDEREQLDLVQRNGLRLQKLVNTLLDFSRIEAGRVQAVYDPIDLATYTAELASTFRSLIEQADMMLVVECPPLPAMVYVDWEMWEKIVLNLLSNAFKFTLFGSITVRLQWVNTHVELSVTDTGVGIPSEELPHLFKRFHRIKNSQGRSFEGSGIGLSLVQELVKLHSGTINVTSILGQGSCFTVSIPTGIAHLPNECISASSTLTSTAVDAVPYVEEAQRWLSQVGSWKSGIEPQDVQINPLLNPIFSTTASSARILLADDNADMRDYIQRLLSSIYEVETVADGLAALSAVQRNPPDLVLSDVMMPRMNGFELLRALRNDAQNLEIPVILLSARAGEESRIEGLTAGADDYLIKPFSARELMARVEATLKLAQLRRIAREREQTLQLETQTVRANLERILSSLREGFLTLDHDWHYTYINDRQLEIIGMTRESVMGRSVWEVFPDIVDTEVYKQFHRVRNERVAVQFEFYYPPLKGWFDHRVYPSDDGIAIFVVDVSERKNSEAERELLLQREQTAREQAELANQVKDEFLAILSHELRSPLNPILGWSQLLQTGDLDAATTTLAVETIERNAQLQSQLIEDLLDISRILQGKLTLQAVSINLSSIISAALDTVHLSAEAKQISIEVTIADSVQQVSGDPMRLQQVVWNLLSNAVKFTDRGGRINMRLTQVDYQVQVQVIDTGKGIHPEFVPFVFEYFRQQDSSTTRKFGGLGLGLAIARQIVELHGGTIWAESAGEGQGTTFSFQIPGLNTVRAVTEAVQKSPLPDLPLADLRVLIVDDDADSRNLLSFLLKSKGAVVTVALRLQLRLCRL